MAILDTGAINAQLKALFRNGRTEIGLEVGADAGLSPDEFIQVPRSMQKRWAVRSVGPNNYKRQPDDGFSDVVNKRGWVEGSAGGAAIAVHKGKYMLVSAPSANKPPSPVDDVCVDEPTIDDLRRFILVNQAHIRANAYDTSHIDWVHAVRFWSTVTGLINTTKSTEFTMVDDPTDDLAPFNVLAQQVLVMREVALTAAAARVTSWRKTNHATGGDIASGYPRRWLQKK